MIKKERKNVQFKNFTFRSFLLGIIRNKKQMESIAENPILVR